MAFDSTEILVDYLETVAAMQPVLLECTVETADARSGRLSRKKRYREKMRSEGGERLAREKARLKAKNERAKARKKEERRNGTRDSL